MTESTDQRTTLQAATYAVLGSPDPGLPPAYRGTSRDLPLVRDDLGLDHPANGALLSLLERGDISGTDLSQELARQLHEGYRGAGVGDFELVEVTRRGRNPNLGAELLGFDVCFTGGGTESLLASILLYESRFGEQTDAETEGRVGPLRDQFRGRLNQHLLFMTDVDAAEFLEAAEATGPWEGADVEWEVVGLWRMNDGAPASGAA